MIRRPRFPELEVISGLHPPLPPSGSVDELDVRLLRAMFPGGVFHVTGIGPGWSMTRIARLARTSRLTARRRLARWREEGLWTRLAIFPHPATLGCSFQMQMFRVRGPGVFEAFDRFAESALRTVMYFQSDNILVPLCLTPNLGARAARRTVPKVPPGVEVMSEPVPVVFPEPRGTLRPADRTIIRALRRAPDLDLSSAARSLRMTERGLRRRVVKLAEAHLLFFFPVMDFRPSNGTIAFVGPLLTAQANEVVVRQALFDYCPDALEIRVIVPPGPLLPPELRGIVDRWISFLVPTGSMAEADRIREEIGRVPGVVDTVVTFPVRTVELPGTVDRALAARPT